MAVYVDVAIWERHERRWCHLLADDPDELHAFAARLGIERRRFQSKPRRPWVDHYDIDETRRRAAVAGGAIELTRRQVVEQIARKRAAALAARERARGDAVTASPTATTPPSSTLP
ncbi:MAG TPA: DUF4031 domain-containing protein [Solirubrobacteraceae bacterium]|jgi:hypothetical protein|nr:DUF4031 domain-containing protein [Solirubrobacteraceae bacterium]